MYIKSSLIISTYKWPEALNLVLESVLNQSVFPTEVIVAEDGNHDETKSCIESFKSRFPCPLIHVYHEDVGFTKSIILNKAIAKSKGDYIIQIDGDCIIHKHFVKDHLEFSNKNTFLYGSRVNIQQSYLPILFSKRQLHFNMFSTGIKKKTRALYMPLLSLFYNKKNNVSKKYRGCNTSYYKSDFISVNGYNENFKGWGREDSELAWRFYNLGMNSRRLRYRGILYHIFHEEKPKDRLNMNNDIEAKTINQKLTWCKNGIDKYLND